MSKPNFLYLLKSCFCHLERSREIRKSFHTKFLALVRNENTFQKLVYPIVASILISYPQFANAQNGEERMKIISTTGINLRADPYTRSTIIGKIPYGEEIIVIEKLKETVYTLNSKYGWYSKQKSYEIPIKGYWIKANYRGEIGYLFSGYLASKEAGFWQPKHKYDSFNKEYFLLFELGNCWYNYPKNNDWHWYGFFIANGQGNFKKINPSFYVSEDKWAIEPTSYHVFSNEESYPIFMLGSKKELPEQVNISSDDFNCFDSYAYTYDPKIIQKKLAEAGIILKNSTKHSRGKLYITDVNGKEFPMGESRLNPAAIHENFLNNVVFKGDIDNDGIDDYILTFGDKSSQTVLFLSTATKDGELVAPVAVYFNGYCC